MISSGYPDFRILYESPFTSKCSYKNRSKCTCTCTHQGRKEVACIVSKPVVSCLSGCGESVNPPKLNIQEVQGALSCRPKGDTGPLITPVLKEDTFFSLDDECIFFKDQPMSVLPADPMAVFFFLNIDRCPIRSDVCQST